MQLFVALISWQGQTDAVQRIAKVVHPHADDLVVIYSNAAETPEIGPGNWHQMPNSAFFGAKFRAALDLYSGGVFLLIHADTDFADWPGLLARCRNLFRDHPGLGLWSPDFDQTHWTNARVLFGPGPGPDLLLVAQTDGIVLALAPRVVERLRRLDYSANTLGWGIDWAASAYCHSHNLMVCRDTRMVVTHSTSRGYGFFTAFDQGTAFLGQLTILERHHLSLLQAHVHARIAREHPVPRRILAAIARRLGLRR